MPRKTEDHPDTPGGIFGRDPLLLQEDSQAAYGKILLHHLLSARIMGNSSPVSVNLLEPESRKRITRQDQKSPIAPGEELVRQYANSRRLRKRIESDDSFSKLINLTMVSRGELTHQRLLTDKNGLIQDHDSAIDMLQQAGAHSTIDKRLRIAAIGYRVKVSRLVGDAYCDEDLCANPLNEPTGDDNIREHLGQTILSRNANVQLWHNTILDHIQCALRRKCHIIVLPEFALPPVTIHNKSDIVEEIAELCGRAEIGDHFLFAGSRHEGVHNRGIVHYRRGVENSGAFPHLKFSSARSLGENILGPYGDRIASYTVRLEEHGSFQIVVAICYDSFDPTMFLRLIHLGTSVSTAPHVILVPSFNPSKIFVEMLRDLSFLVKCPVVYVNGLHGDARMYICGFALADLVGRQDELKNQLSQRVLELEDEQAEWERHRALDPGIKGQNLDPLGKRISSKLVQAKALLRELSFGSLTHSLENLITVEHCEHCKNGTHGENDSCRTDILYYNIDPSLIHILMAFRKEYFLPESFLPESWRAD